MIKQMSNFHLGFVLLKQLLLYNSFNSVLIKTNCFCTIHPKKKTHQMLFVFGTLLSVFIGGPV